MPIVCLHQAKVPGESINYAIAIEAAENISEDEGYITSYYSCFV